MVAGALLKFLITVALLLQCVAMQAADNEPLDFGFIKNPPGTLVAFEHHRLHADCQGQGEITVLFEAGLGGSAMEWIPVRDKISTRTRTCIYDRAGYAWSDPSPYPRVARQLALEASAMLKKLALNKSLILVGHSFGGLVIRELAALPDISVKAMVLVDASHEDQFDRLQIAGGKAMMPTGQHFVLAASDVPDNLPVEIKRKVKALSRMRKTYSATHAEMSLFRESARQIRRIRTKVDYPVTVVSRGRDLYADTQADTNRNTIWQQLQSDLVTLSSDGRFVRADKSGHHVHVDDPALIVRIIEGLLDEIDQKK